MDKHNFFGKLFDLSFSEFITLQIIKYLYIISVVFSGIVSLGVLGGGFAAMRYDFLKGITGVLLSPVTFILLIVLFRLLLEGVVAVFRIAENTTILVEKNNH